MIRTRCRFAVAAFFFVLGICGAHPVRADDISRYTGDLATLQPLTQGRRLWQVEVDGHPVIGARGPTSLFSVEIFAVDPAKSYRVSVRLRVIKDDPKVGGGIVHAGVVTFDRDGKELTSGVGTYRYAAAAHTLVRKSEGWTELSGIIKGQGDRSFNEFRPGTASVKLVALLNYGTPDAAMQLDFLRFEEIKGG